MTTVRDLPAELIRDELFKHIVTMLDSKIMHSTIIVFRRFMTQEYIESIKPLFIKYVREVVDGQVLRYYTLPNGTRHGSYICSSKTHIYTCNYYNGLRQGPYISKSRLTDTISICNYIDDKLQGVMLGYYPTGEKRYYRRHIDGKRQGLALEYYQTGELKRRYGFKDGKYFGKSINYSINGLIDSITDYFDLDENWRTITYGQVTRHIVSIKTYHKGKLNGPYKKFNQNGVLHDMGEYVNGYNI